MEIQKRVGVFYAVLLYMAGCVAAGPLFAQDEIPWLDNYGEGIREAKRTQKPIFLEFRCEP